MEKLLSSDKNSVVPLTVTVVCSPKLTHKLWAIPNELITSAKIQLQMPYLVNSI